MILGTHTYSFDTDQWFKFDIYGTRGSEDMGHSPKRSVSKKKQQNVTSDLEITCHLNFSEHMLHSVDVHALYPISLLKLP